MSKLIIHNIGFFFITLRLSVIDRNIYYWNSEYYYNIIYCKLYDFYYAYNIIL